MWLMLRDQLSNFFMYQLQPGVVIILSRKFQYAHFFEENNTAGDFNNTITHQ
jgi:hypothetical protein